jgi:hypothetical protein
LYNPKSDLEEFKAQLADWKNENPNLTYRLVKREVKKTRTIFEL